MIKSDLVNPQSLSETVNNDVYTALWMRYACLSPNIRRSLSAGSPKAKEFYCRLNRYNTLSLLTLGALLADGITVYFSHSILWLTAGIISTLLLAWFEHRKRNLVVKLSKELLAVLWIDSPPKGTFFQFGEELARKYNITSFVDFNGKLDKFLKHGFFIILTIAMSYF